MTRIVLIPEKQGKPSDHSKTPPEQTKHPKESGMLWFFSNEKNCIGLADEQQKSSVAVQRPQWGSECYVQKITSINDGTEDCEQWRRCDGSTFLSSRCHSRCCCLHWGIKHSCEALDYCYNMGEAVCFSARLHTIQLKMDAENLHDHVTPNMWPTSSLMLIQWTVPYGEWLRGNQDSTQHCGSQASYCACNGKYFQY